MNRMTSSIWLKTLRRIWPAALACLPAHAAEPNFNRDIRPILSENCFLCHGQDPKHRGGELRLDIREEAVAVRDGAAAIVPGNPDQSEIIQRILSKDPDVRHAAAGRSPRRHAAGADRYPQTLDRRRRALRTALVVRSSRENPPFPPEPIRWIISSIERLAEEKLDAQSARRSGNPRPQAVSRSNRTAARARRTSTPTSPTPAPDRWERSSTA